MEPVADAVWAPATRSENASNGRATYSLATARVQDVRDRLVRPNVAKDHTVFRWSLTRDLYDLAPCLQRNARWSAAPRRVQKRLDARARLPADSPLAHDAVAAPDEPGDRRGTMPVGKPDDHPRTDHDVVLGVPSPREGLYPRPFGPRYAYSSRSRTRAHAPSSHEADLLFPSTDGSGSNFRPAVLGRLGGRAMRP
jgi:hypothetical protein